MTMTTNIKDFFDNLESEHQLALYRRIMVKLVDGKKI